MSLFQKSVEKKYLNELDTTLVERKYKDFQHYFGNPAIQENIRNAKEEQFQEGFLRELFVSIFGYTLNPHPNFNLTTELKNIANSKKADGAILTRGHDPLSTPFAIAIIELKGTDTTDLDKIEAQAFGYKNHHPKCVYVITSNFEKLRFYIQNAVDHLDFDLFNLSSEQFSLMWLCLAKDNLLNGLPQKIKESSVLQEENITKKLYADYSKFREAIYNNLVLNNPETDKLLLFRKTQKLIDRFLFIFFAEDRLLVPPNSISQIIEKWKDDSDFGDVKPLYHTFKKYFHVLNVGRPKSGNRQEIFAYNGGLFSEDEILDNFNIDDTILFEHTLKLSQYNYETDVDVNILGHIFEHSLGDIAAIAATAASEHAHLSATPTPSVRKRDGIFYTPKYITKYIVENTVGKLCEEKRAALEIIDEEYAKGRKNRKKDTITALDKKLTEYRNWLLSLTILDPACGSGAFLNQALDFLITEHRKIDDLRAQLFGSGLVFSDITTDILEKNIYGVDINEESVEIAKLSLWLRTAQKGRKLNKLNNNIKCGNSLIDDPEVAGEKAFNWQNEFPNIFQKKNKKAWHVTTATHNSRYSQRMFDSFVKLGEPVWLSEKEELIVSETIAEIAEKDNLNILAYNICGDHAHILLVCEEEELPKIVQKIKSMSARACNIAMGRTIPAAETTEHAPREGRGKTQFHLWTQKFGNTPITSTEQLENTIRYIENNRIKHGLDGNDGACSLIGSVSPDQNKGASSLVNTPPVDNLSSRFSSSGSKLAAIAKRITCTREHAFRSEYKGGFDVVIGNPPYGATLDDISKQFITSNYQCFKGNFDIYSAFIQLAFQICKRNGFWSFINPVSWQTGENYILLRQFLLQNGKLEIAIKLPYDVFENAYVDTGIYVVRAINSINYESLVYEFPIRFKQLGDLSTDTRLKNLPSQYWSELDSLKIVLNPSYYELLPKLFKNTISLNDISDSIRGILPGENDVSEINISGNKLYFTGGLYRYKIERDFQYVNYGDHLKEKPKDYSFFQGERILIRRLINRQFQIMANYADDEFVNKKDLYNLKVTNDDYQIKYLLAIINSKLISFLKIRGATTATKDDFGQLTLSDIRQIPIKFANDKKQQEFSECVDLIIHQTNQFQKTQNQFHDLLQVKFNLEKLNQKLQNWNELSFSEFLKELQKAKIKLSLSEEAEWMNYFNEQKQKAQTLKSEIEKTDREIDRMVYALYGLTEEEIKIVEGAV